jgi:hypothetical protein
LAPHSVGALGQGCSQQRGEQGCERLGGSNVVGVSATDAKQPGQRVIDQFQNPLDWVLLISLAAHRPIIGGWPCT